MSLADKMRLQELKNECDTLMEPRTALLKTQISKAGEDIKKGIIEFFKSKNFTVEGSGSNIKVHYKGGLQTKIDFSCLLKGSWGCDGLVDFEYESRKYSLIYIVERGNLPQQNGGVFNSNDEMRKTEIDYYEKQLIPALKELKMTDLTGNYSISVIAKANTATGSGRSEKFENIEDALDSFIC
ncbi:TPA: hypothetical protein ACRRXV_000953 [Morganella morganii]